MVAGAHTGIFQGRESFIEPDDFNKHFTFDIRKKDRGGKITHVLNLFLFFYKFQPQCSYKIFRTKKILTWTNSCYAERTASVEN